MNTTLKSAYRMLWRAFKRATFETLNTMRQNLKALRYLVKSGSKRERVQIIERERYEMFLEEVQ